MSRLLDYAALMATKSESSKSNQRPYHHGDLRSALLDAGLQLVQREGIDAVTLRKVAHQAGVSHAAPYHHFKDKAELIEALAVEAYRHFKNSLTETWAAESNLPMQGLGALGVAYVHFALEHPAEFRLMHLPGMRQTEEYGKPSTISVAATEAYNVLRNAIDVCQQQGLIDPGDTDSYALTAWSSVHGLAVLLLDGMIDEYDGTIKSGEELAGLVTQTLGHGLKIR